MGEAGLTSSSGEGRAGAAGPDARRSPSLRGRIARSTSCACMRRDRGSCRYITGLLRSRLFYSYLLLHDEGP